MSCCFYTFIPPVETFPSSVLSNLIISFYEFISKLKMVASKDMTPFPKTFGKIFWNNQFKVVIDLPTRSKYPDLANKVAIITGANSGLGFEAAKQFINLGLPHLILAVRSLSRGNEAASKLRAGNARVAISVWELDMESYDSIQAFVRKCNAEFQCIDFVILNAGLGPNHSRKARRRDVR